MSTTILTAKAVAEAAHERMDGTLYSVPASALVIDDHTTAGLRFAALMRFTGLNIPRGANVTSAVMNVTAESAESDDPEVEISCDDVDNCDALADLADVANTRVPRKTTADTTWSATAIGVGVVASPSFAAALEEILRRPGYEALNAIGVLFVGGNVAIKSFTILNSPTLTITYTILSSQNALAITSTSGVAYVFDRRVSEVTIQCDTGSAKPIQFKVPGVVNDWFELAAGKSISVFAPPNDSNRRLLAEVLFKVASGTGTASYVTSGA